MIPGEHVLRPEPVVINAGRPVLELDVVNRGDRPVQVGSHFHFAETNPALAFDRDAARGFRLDIPSGTSLRFEPGASRQVAAVRFSGSGRVPGLQMRPEGYDDAADDGAGTGERA